MKVRVKPEYPIRLVHHRLRSILGKRGLELFVQHSVFQHQFIVFGFACVEIALHHGQRFHQLVDVIFNVALLFPTKNRKVEIAYLI